MEFILGEIFLSNSSDSNTDSDEEQHRDVRHCINNFAEETVDTYTNKEFVNQFRINRNVFEDLSNRFSQNAIYLSLQAHPAGKVPVTARKHILIYLYFVGHEASSYRAMINIFNISLSTLFDVINRVANWLCSIAPSLIQWPNNAGIQNTQAYFSYHKSFPGVVGLIDGSHIVIDKPRNDPDSYINRKGQYSIHMQAIVNENKKFIDVFIGYPGSVHDARVFKNSTIYPTLMEKCQGGYILGDSAYPLIAACLTPFKDNGHLTPKQQYYNNKHSAARIFVEHAFGLLKQRFRYLYHIKLRSIKLIVLLIKSCIVLHNMADKNDLDDLDAEENHEIPGHNQNVQNQVDDTCNDTGEGRALRDVVVNEIWNRQ